MRMSKCEALEIHMGIVRRDGFVVVCCFFRRMVHITANTDVKVAHCWRDLPNGVVEILVPLR